MADITSYLGRIWGDEGQDEPEPRHEPAVVPVGDEHKVQFVVRLHLAEPEMVMPVEGSLTLNLALNLTLNLTVIGRRRRACPLPGGFGGQRTAEP